MQKPMLPCRQYVFNHCAVGVFGLRSPGKKPALLAPDDGVGRTR